MSPLTFLIIKSIVKWYSRKRSASRATSELQHRAFSEQQASVAKWLKGQAIHGRLKEFENEQW